MVDQVKDESNRPRSKMLVFNKEDDYFKQGGLSVKDLSKFDSSYQTAAHSKISHVQLHPNASLP